MLLAGTSRGAVRGAAHRRAAAAPRTSTVALAQAGRGRARGPQDLNDPAQIGANGTSSTVVRDYGGDLGLSQYMLLPVEQYFVLDPNQIQFIEGNRFLLKVPRVELLNVWMEPEVEISVTTQRSPPRVLLRADNCRIRGSDLVENLKLDERFCLRFDTQLAWSGAPESSSASMNSMRSFDGAMSSGEIVGTCQVDVWCEVVPPFNLMPREVLQASCNVVMKGLVSTLLPMFVKKLGEDYERWARDPAYRQDRASRRAPLSVLR